MKGIHINWTKPYLVKHRQLEYKQQQYELLVQLLSVLYWKKFYGEIKLYTDKAGYEYYKRCKFPILDLYDVVEVITLNNLHTMIDPKVFWAGGKIASIQKETTPFVMLDLDLFLTDNITGEFEGYDLVFSHYETLNNPVYPNPKDITNNGLYNLPNYNWNIMPGNVCVTYFGDDNFKDKYTEESLRYMTSFGADGPVNTLDKHNARMVFAEQRLLTCIANSLGYVDFKPLINDIYNTNTTHIKYNGSDINNGEEASWFHTGNSNIGDVPIHHTWGYKHLLVNKGLKLLYVESLHKLIKKDFPEYEKYLGDPNDE